MNSWRIYNQKLYGRGEIKTLMVWIQTFLLLLFKNSTKIQIIMFGEEFAYFLLKKFCTTTLYSFTSNRKMLRDFRLLLHLLFQFALIITTYKQITSVTICANYVTNRKWAKCVICWKEVMLINLRLATGSSISTY